MRLIDLPKIPEGIHRRLEQRSEEQGQRVADALIESTSQGRGLWVIVLLPAWAIIFAGASAVAQVYLGLPLLAGAIAGIVVAMIWWKHDFTRRHPLLSSMVANACLPFFIFLTEK